MARRKYLGFVTPPSYTRWGEGGGILKAPKPAGMVAYTRKPGGMKPRAKRLSRLSARDREFGLRKPKK